MAKKAETLPAGIAPKETPSISARAQGLTVGGLTLKVKRQVTLPLLKQKAGETVVIKPEGPYFVGKQMPAKVNAKGEMVSPDPATVVNVINLQNGMLMQYLVNAVLRDIWATEYKNDAYIGKGFAIMKMPADEGKRHNNMQIAEIDLDDLAAQLAA